MKLEVLRFSSQNESTLGMLLDVTDWRNFYTSYFIQEWVSFGV
tara:strand:+ start:357 stop:485 length:129 start_codon:yes stop_codon:yes gene_type:complete